MLRELTGAFAVVTLLVAGVVTGVAGFGLALVGTMALATLLAPAVAVVVMLVPILSTNVSLLGELDADGLRSCARRFWPYVLAALAGTIAGMTLLTGCPGTP